MKRGNGSSAAQTVTVAAVSPGIFTVNGQGTGAGAILHPDNFRLVSESEPARPGEFVSIFCTGPGFSSTLAPTVTIGGLQATVSFAGPAPGFVGLQQVNVQAPANAPKGSAVPLVLTIGGVASNTVTIAVLSRGCRL